MSEVIIETEGLTKRYGNFTAVESLDLRLGEGEVFGFLGPNGSGKSTLARALVGTVRASGGQVLWRGEDLLSMAPGARRRRRRGGGATRREVGRDPLRLRRAEAGRGRRGE